MQPDRRRQALWAVSGESRDSETVWRVWAVPYSYSCCRYRYGRLKVTAASFRAVEIYGLP